MKLSISLFLERVSHFFLDLVQILILFLDGFELENDHLRATVSKSKNWALTELFDKKLGASTLVEGLYSCTNLLPLEVCFAIFLFE